jgi:hypothetical protein
MQCRMQQQAEKGGPRAASTTPSMVLLSGPQNIIFHDLLPYRRAELYKIVARKPVGDQKLAFILSVLVLRSCDRLLFLLIISRDFY